MTIKEPQFVAETEWIAPITFPDLSECKEIAIDLETKDPDLKTKGSGAVINQGKVVGIAVAVDGWEGYYPIAHEGGGNMDKDIVLKWFKKILLTPADKIFHNAMYDVCWIRAMNLEINGKILDTMIAVSLIDELRGRYDLDSVSQDFIGEKKKQTGLYEAATKWQVDPKQEMYKLPAMYVGAYAEKDAYLTFKLWQKCKEKLDQDDIWDIFEMETELTPCLIDMKFKGVRVDVEGAHALKKKLLKREEELLLQIKKATNIDVQIWAAASVARVFEHLKIDFDRTQKTKAPSFKKDFLKNHSHPIVKQISETREINKTRTTFIDTIIKHSYKERIHADINQIRGDNGGTITGRFSYQNPNLQQVPARDKEIGPAIRGLFLPEKGCRWGCFDYNQQEPRLVVHYASLKNLYGVDEIVDAYKEDKADFHKVVADMAEIPRTQAKTINLGLFYGMGKAKLAASLGVSKEQAEDLLSKYNTKVPFVNILLKDTMKRAQHMGKIRTIGGRLCRFNKWEPRGFGVKKAMSYDKAIAEHGPGIQRAFTYKALNKLIQGSAADMTKKALIKLHKKGIVPHIQIHDELNISLDHKQVNKKRDQIKKIMEEAISLEIPNRVDFEVGDTWGDISYQHGSQSFDYEDSKY